MNSIDGVSDPEFRSKLASTFSGLQSQREFSYVEKNINSPKYQRDLVYLFENRHLNRAAELIQLGEYDAADKLLTTITNLSNMYVDESDFHPEDNRTNVKLWYADRLLQCLPEEIPELASQVEYLRMVGISYTAACGDIMFDAFGNDGIDVFGKVKELGLSHPRDVIVGLMGMMYKDKAVRDYFISFNEQLNTILAGEQQGDTPSSRDNLIANLDYAAEEFGSSVPMIKVMHHLKVMQFLRRVDPDQAKKRMDMVISSIREVEASGISQRLGYDKIMAKRKASIWKKVKEERGVMYRAMGYNRIAEFYEDSAKNTNW
jgi:hypothetical protein